MTIIFEEPKIKKLSERDQQRHRILASIASGCSRGADAMRADPAKRDRLAKRIESFDHFGTVAHMQAQQLRRGELDSEQLNQIDAMSGLWLASRGAADPDLDLIKRFMGDKPADFAPPPKRAATSKPAAIDAKPYRPQVTEANRRDLIEQELTNRAIAAELAARCR